MKWHLWVEAVFFMDPGRNNQRPRIGYSRDELFGKRSAIRKRIPFRQDVFKVDCSCLHQSAVVQHGSKEPLSEILSIVIISAGNNDGQHQSPCAKTTREPGALIPTFNGSMRGSAARIVSWYSGFAMNRRNPPWPAPSSFPPAAPALNPASYASSLCGKLISERLRFNI